MISLMWPAVSLRVLNVGDGACAVITAADGERAILDCGSWRSPGHREARLLSSSLGRQTADVTTLLVVDGI
jgi:hypothetical protein